MLMVLVMHVWMRMFHQLVLVLVAMHLGDMEPDARTHQSASGNELGCHRLA